MTKEEFKRYLQGLIQSTGNLNIKPEMRIEYIVMQLESMKVLNLKKSENKQK